MKKTLCLSLFLALLASQGRSLVVNVRPVLKEHWAVSLRGGMAIPAGDLANFARSQAGLGADLYYNFDPRFSLAAFYQYATMPYKNTGSNQPFSSNSLGGRALLYVLRADDFSGYLDAGLGVYLVNHAVVDPKALNLTNNFNATNQSDAGLGFLAGGGVEFLVFPHVSVLADMSFNSLNLGGGTGDNILYAVLAAGVKYGF
jgi:hypothetical protein